ncbi:MAG: RIP metalloprotease RseP [Novosphingobium sp.]
MFGLPTFLQAIFGFLLLIGPLVVLHELGHYLVARWLGVKSDVFSIGFGKELLGWTDKRGTRWRLAAVPLGGYVQFAGDGNAVSQTDDNKIADMSAEERGHAFATQKLWKRAAIVAAGPIANLLVAVAIFAAFYLVVGRQVLPPEVTGYSARSDAQAAGIRIGDKIIAVDGSRVDSVTEVLTKVVLYPGQTVSITVTRNGAAVDVPVKLSEQSMKDSSGSSQKYADLGLSYGLPVVGEVQSGSPAAKAGLQAGDRILSIAGQPVVSYPDIQKIVRAAPEKPLAVSLRRDGAVIATTVTPRAVEVRDGQGNTMRLGQMGITNVSVVKTGPIEAVTLAASNCWEIVRMQAIGLKQIVTGSRSVREMSGPIKMAQVSGEQLTQGWLSFVQFAAFISINLAFINLLPIPTLDGGHLAFYAAEAVRRRPVDAKGQEWAFRTGLAFVLALMLFVTINDIASLLPIGK